MIKEIISVDGGFGYQIICDIKNIRLYQDFHPQKSGFIPMTEEEAREGLLNTLLQLFIDGQIDEGCLTPEELEYIQNNLPNEEDPEVAE